MSLFLDDDELHELTGYRHRAKQKMALAKLGVQFRIRPADGYPLVHRDATKPSARDSRARPDFGALDKVS